MAELRIVAQQLPNSAVDLVAKAGLNEHLSALVGQGLCQDKLFRENSALEIDLAVQQWWWGKASARLIVGRPSSCARSSTRVEDE
jgi:hypothetical protein